MNKRMKTRQALLVCGLLTGLFLMAGCREKPQETYTYHGEDALGIDLKKTEVYEDKIVLHFSKDSFDSVDSILCYDAQFQKIATDASFEAKEDVLTVYTAEAEAISGIRIDVDSHRYLQLRYLDSDTYVMLQYDFADDYGHFISGDEDAYYTEEEKALQVQREAENQAERERAFAMVEGTWDTEDGYSRFEIYDPETLTIEEYRYNDGGWDYTGGITGDYVSAEDTGESIVVRIAEDGYGMCYEFSLNEDMTQFTYNGTTYYKTEAY